jgi:hypothetical protein
MRCSRGVKIALCDARPRRELTQNAGMRWLMAVASVVAFGCSVRPWQARSPTPELRGREAFVVSDGEAFVLRDARVENGQLRGLVTRSWTTPNMDEVVSLPGGRMTRLQAVMLSDADPAEFAELQAWVETRPPHEILIPVAMVDYLAIRTNNGAGRDTSRVIGGILLGVVGVITVGVLLVGYAAAGGVGTH